MRSGSRQSSRTGLGRVDLLRSRCRSITLAAASLPTLDNRSTPAALFRTELASRAKSALALALCSLAERRLSTATRKCLLFRSVTIRRASSTDRASPTSTIRSKPSPPVRLRRGEAPANLTQLWASFSLVVDPGVSCSHSAPSAPPHLVRTCKLGRDAETGQLADAFAAHDLAGVETVDARLSPLPSDDRIGVPDAVSGTVASGARHSRPCWERTTRTPRVRAGRCRRRRPRGGPPASVRDSGAGAEGRRVRFS